MAETRSRRKAKGPDGWVEVIHDRPTTVGRGGARFHVPAETATMVPPEVAAHLAAVPRREDPAPAPSPPADDTDDTV